MKPKMPDEARRWLESIADNALMRAKAEVGGYDPRPRACALAYKELQDEFYRPFMEWLEAHALTVFIHDVVYGRVDQARQHYIPKDDGDDNLPEIFLTDTRQPVWIKPPGPGGKPTPKLMVEASPTDHERIAQRREQQGLLLMRKSRWHKEVVDWADRNGISEDVVDELFEIEPPDDDDETEPPHER